MRSSWDSLEMPGYDFLVVGTKGQMSFFFTKRGDRSSISWPSTDSRARCAAMTFLTQSVRGPYKGMNR